MEEGQVEMATHLLNQDLINGERKPVQTFEKWGSLYERVLMQKELQVLICPPES